MCGRVSGGRAAAPGGGGGAAGGGSCLLPLPCGQHCRLSCLATAGLRSVPVLASRNSWSGELHAACGGGRPGEPCVTPKFDQVPQKPMCRFGRPLARPLQVQHSPLQPTQARGWPGCWGEWVGPDLFACSRGGLQFGCTHFCARCQPPAAAGGAGRAGHATCTAPLRPCLPGIS